MLMLMLMFNAQCSVVQARQARLRTVRCAAAEGNTPAPARLVTGAAWAAFLAYAVIAAPKSAPEADAALVLAAHPTPFELGSARWVCRGPARPCALGCHQQLHLLHRASVFFEGLIAGGLTLWLTRVPGYPAHHSPVQRRRQLSIRGTV
jgi:hypothetical protein